MKLFAEVTSPDTNRTVQAVWFKVDTVIGGFQFKADDIAFGYVPHTTGEDFGDIVATAGFSKGDAIFGINGNLIKIGTFSAIPGTDEIGGK